MSIYIYQSTDTSAPQLTGLPGSFINVLDACLVNGYGSQPSLGQTKPYSDTNLAVYQMPSGTSGMYLAVDDTLGKQCRLRGFTSMTGAQYSAMQLNIQSPPIGSHPFPNDSQVSGGTQFQKSATADSTVRPQTIISNGKIFYFQSDHNSDAVHGKIMVFGDIISYNNYDTNPCILIGSHTDDVNYFMDLVCVNSSPSHYLCQRYDGNGYSIPFGKSPINGLYLFSSSMVMGMSGNLLAYPDPFNGSMWLTPIAVVEDAPNGQVLRGRMPGLQAPIHPNTVMNTFDTVEGGASGALAGKTFMAFQGGHYQGVQTSWLMGWYLMETSDTWNSGNFR